jgi:hypothetical protein
VSAKLSESSNDKAFEEYSWSLASEEGGLPAAYLLAIKICMISQKKQPFFRFGVFFIFILMAMRQYPFKHLEILILVN